MKSALAAAALSVLIAGAAPAAAHSIELVRQLDATPLAQTFDRSVGEPRFMAVSQVLYDDRGGFVQVLDLDAVELIRVAVSLGSRSRGQLVRFGGDRVGLLIQDIGEGGAWTSRYVEIDPVRGTPTRSVELGAYSVADLQFYGTDPVADVAWFAIIEPHPQLANTRQLVLRSVNLSTLSISDHVKVPMRARTSSSGYETWLQFYPSADFTKVVATEYAEDGIDMDAARAWVIDVEKFSWFDIEAPSTAYAGVFSADNAYLYLISNQRGSISRVDLATRRVDKKVFGLKAAHHLAIAPDSGRLYAVGSSVYAASLTLPDLGGRRTSAFAPPVRDRIRYLFGSGAMSADGRFLVVEGDYTRGAEPRELFVLRMK